jgi:hypothetical protein
MELLIDVKADPGEAARIAEEISRLTSGDYGSLIMGDLSVDVVRVRVVGPAADLHG